MMDLLDGCGLAALRSGPVDREPCALAMFRQRTTVLHYGDVLSWQGCWMMRFHLITDSLILIKTRF